MSTPAALAASAIVVWMSFLSAYGPQYFETRCAGHSVTQRHDLREPMLILSTWKNFTSGSGRRAVFEDLVGVGTLDLEAIVGAVDSLAVGAAVRTRIVLEAYVPFAVGCLEQDPVGGRRTAHQDEFSSVSRKTIMSPITWPAGVTGTKCLATFSLKLAKLLMPT